MMGERKKLGGKFLAIFLVLTLLLSLVSGDGYEPQDKNPLWKKFMKGATDSLVYFTGNFVNRVLLIYSSLTPKIKETGKLTYGDLEKYLLENPDLDNSEVSSLISYFITILEPLYVAAIIIIGLYLIFFSTSPLGRAKAKSSLLRLILSLILISITPTIIKLLFSLSNGITQSVLSFAPSNAIELHLSSISYSLYLIQNIGIADIPTTIPFILFSLFLTIGAFLILILRYLLVILLTALFPLAIFFFSFKPTKKIGQILLSQLFFWIFLPVSFAVALVAIALGENLFHYVIAELWNFALAGTLALILSPVGMFYATKETMEVLEKLLKKMAGVEKKLIPELEEIEIPEKEVEAELKEISKQGKIKEKQIKERERLYKQLQKEAEKKETTVEELVKEKYDLKLISEKKPLKRETILPQIKIRIPQPFKRKRATKIGVVLVKLGLRVKPTSASLKIAEGATKKLEIEVNNLTNLILHEIELTDRNLAENNILLSYSKNNFSLMPGESKEIKVKIAVIEGTKVKTYEGIIFVTCKEGYKNFIDVKVTVVPKGEEIAEEEIEELEEVTPQLIQRLKPTLVELASVDGEINYDELKEDTLLFKKISKAAEAEGKTVEEFVKEEYGLRVVKEKDKESLCERLSNLANVDNEIGLDQLKSKKELYEEVSKNAEEEEKSLPEYIKEKCELILLKEERRAEPTKLIEPQRIVPHALKKVEEKKKVKEEKERKEKLALPAPEAPPKIIFP